jgi:hypothetical protein
VLEQKCTSNQLSLKNKMAANCGRHFHLSHSG